ncbi:CU044_5270 family protein [Nonomuraea sp. NPDC049784]|uniref:CU044_5270 family protein n=1 Tax=Nonomuraea sp. NPDC049784 TaxID=3154361 RepID=UPI00340C3BC2
MNPIDELKAARPAHLDDDRPIDPRTRAAELSRAMSVPRPARRRRGAVRPAWGLGLAGAAAAVTAAVVVLSMNGTAPAPRPSTGSPASVPNAQKVTLSARDVLLAAAEKADRQSDGSGAYWHSESVRRTMFAAAQGGYLVMDQERNEGWTPRATGADQEQWSRDQPLGARPVTEQDRQAWERAGSPAEIKVTVPGKGAPKGDLVLSTSPGKASSGHMPLVDGDKVFWLGRNVTMKDLLGLPSDPGKLKRWLRASYEGHDTESSSVPMSEEAWLFRVSMGLIMDMPVTPEVRGAAFRMLAELDGVKVIENVTDAEGRRGTAVAIKERTQGDGVSENRLIFDEATGRALANENVVVKPGGFQAGFEPGTVWNSNALIEAGWTDAKP